MKKKDFKTTIFQDKRSVFRLNDIALLLRETNADNIKQKINYYIHTGVLKNIRKGIYTKSEFQQEELAGNIYSPSYISLEYVLQKAGVIFQYSENITVVSYLSRKIKFKNTVIQFRKIKNEILINNNGIISKNGVNIASPERALLDTLYLNKDFYFDNLNSIDAQKIKKLLPVYNSKKLEQRVKVLFNDKH